jgi:hypothetical protein
LQTCQTKSAASQVHDWVVHKLGVLFGLVGHRVKNPQNYTSKGQGTRLYFFPKCSIGLVN